MTKIQALLEELARLESITGFTLGYSIKWTPNPESRKEGQVLGGIIHIYSCNLQEAIHTLQHEFFDILISKTNKPYVEIINMLLSIISEKIYKEKEEIIESLVGFARHSSSYASAKNYPTVA